MRVHNVLKLMKATYIRYSIYIYICYYIYMDAGGRNGLHYNVVYNNIPRNIFSLKLC